MKANELMIGDWAIVHGPADQRFTRKLDMGDLSFFVEFEPIPLTPEILEKNGFKMAKWKEDEPAGLLGKWWDNRGQVLVKRFDFTLLGEVYSVKANNSRISNIRYVHELQHALRLCGIDKEIVL